MILFNEGGLGNVVSIAIKSGDGVTLPLKDVLLANGNILDLSIGAAPTPANVGNGY